MTMTLTVVLFCALALPLLVTSQPAGDRINSLPNYNGPLGVQYSGYLNIDPSTGKNLHYWFVQSENNPAKDPLVLWLNGGPGCSSLDGFFYEQGPLHFEGPTSNVSLVQNPWAWTKIANMIFLEAPAGVGFSYSDTQSDYTTDDNKTAADNYQALKLWFKSFPQFANHEFWISGESYAGIYVPTLAYLVMKDSQINFQGILVGNGVTDWSYDNAVHSHVPFIYGKGFIDDQTWTDFQEYCVNGDPNSKQCADTENRIDQNMAGINIYDVYGPCYSTQRPQFPKWMQDKMGFRFPSQLRRNNVGEVPPCLDASQSQAYLNLADLKKAIHVKSNINWDICTEAIDYNSDTESVIPIYQALMAGGFHILVYSGDTDGAVPYTGTAAWLNSLTLPLSRQPAWQPWQYTSPEGSQTGGFVTYYKGLTFTTIRGSGHMVPQYRPQAGYYMFQQFIEGKPF